MVDVLRGMEEAFESTPLLEQFSAIKTRYPEAILFYRMGDFYEMFYEDAQIASQVLGLKLTSRAHGKGGKVPLAGFPYHQIDQYLTRMVEAGYRVVIVEQVEDPKKAKGLVKRDVVQVVTAGTNPAALEAEEVQPRRVAAIIKIQHKYGFAWAEVASGEFQAGEFDYEGLKEVVFRISPVELVVPWSSGEVGPSPGSERGQMVSRLEDWVWEPTFATRTLTDHFGTKSLKGFGLEDKLLAISAAGALLYYLKQNIRTSLVHITGLGRIETRGTLVMEPHTRRHLELTESLAGNPRATLFAVMDATVTPAGRRLLHQRLNAPLADRLRIEERLEAVEALLQAKGVRQKLRNLLRRTGDLGRYIARLSTARGSPRDLVAIRETLELIPEIKEALREVNAYLLKAISQQLDPLESLKDRLRTSLVDEPPLSPREGGIIRPGFDQEVDQLRLLTSGGEDWLKALELRERAKWGIPNLKVGYNRVFGYYIEVTKSHLDKVPAHYVRRQTLTNAERFTIPELQDYEAKILDAEEKLKEREEELYRGLVDEVLRQAATIQEIARGLAEIDLQAALAEIAELNHYTRPTLYDDDRLVIKGGRHPVVEALLPPGESFTPNDLDINPEGARIFLITGPNMAGKSTYLRQVGLIVIMAQMGSFVPASEAHIGVVDRLFTRIGAMDNLAGGESTFLVEMQETASILHNLTPSSLILFDEIGRGTSTFDGLAIAWSIVEHLHQQTRIPRTLFATHFHELTDLEKYLPYVKNLNVAVQEYGDKVVFLHKILPGASDRSFGIYVAQMAGLPSPVILRAREVLISMESLSAQTTSPTGCLPSQSQDGGTGGKSSPSAESPYPRALTVQLTLFDPVERQIRQKLSQIDPLRLTPWEAIKILSELKNLL